MPRRPVLAVVGQGAAVSREVLALAESVGRLAIDAGFRVATGGLGGVMEAASRGARSAAGWRDGDVLGILPSYDAATANEWIDVALPTGLGLGRNVVLVAAADVVLAIAGGSGTLAEIALAWQLGKPIVALASSGGWAERLAGEAIDAAARAAIVRADHPADAIAAALRLIPATIP